MIALYLWYLMGRGAIDTTLGTTYALCARFVIVLTVHIPLYLEPCWMAGCIGWMWLDEYLFHSGALG